MALFAFNIVAARNTEAGTIISHPGAMLEAANEYEALGRATKIADKLMPQNDYAFRHVKVWPATQVVDPDKDGLILAGGTD